MLAPTLTQALQIASLEDLQSVFKLTSWREQELNLHVAIPAIFWCIRDLLYHIAISPVPFFVLI